MDSWEAAIAAVFGSLTDSKAAPTLFEALLPWITCPDSSRKNIAANVPSFAKLLEQLASAVAKNTPRTALTRRSRSARRTIVTRRPTAGRRPRRSQCAQNTYSSRRQVEKESCFSAAGHVRTLAASCWRYHDSLTTGRELNTATTVQWPRHRPSSRDGRALAGVGANDGINRLVISGMVARVSGGQPHLQRFPLVRPNLRGDRAVFGFAFRQRSRRAARSRCT